MDINRSLIGVSAILSEDGRVADVDLESLVRRLLLFDRYVLHSVRLQEFPILARRLGYERLRDLLSANLIEVRCECLQLTQTAQSGMCGDPVLPSFHYQFHWIDAHDKASYVDDGLQSMHEVGSIRHKDILRLKRAIANAIRPLSPEIRPQLFPPFQHELLYNLGLVKKSVELAIRRRLGQEAPSFSLKVHQESENTFRAETDLACRLQIDELEAHKLIEAGLLGLAALTQAIGEMKAYSALNGFREEELPLFRDKLDVLADAVSSQPKEHNFQRIVDIAGLPRLSAENGTVNVEQLLKVRDSREAREFRDWLGGIGGVTESEIKERVSGLRALIGLKVSGPSARAIRFLVTSAIGVVPHVHPAATLALGAFDQFIFDKLLPRSGIAAFMSELYPSIFEQSSNQSTAKRGTAA
jgi:hypothetical protein